MYKYLKVILLITILQVSSFSYALANKASTAVNAFAWNASLKVTKFMPLISADINSGTIITDWFQVNANARYKLDIYVIGGPLTPTAIEVSVFKQIKSGADWKDTKPSLDISTQLEGAILNEALLLRQQQS